MYKRKFATYFAISTAAGILGFATCKPDAPPTSAQSAPAAASVPATALKNTDFRSLFTNIAKLTVPSVVSIATQRLLTAEENPFNFFGRGFPFDFFGLPEGGEDAPQREYRQSGLGSGFMIRPEGYILTNNHVVENAQNLKVLLSDQRELEVEVVGGDAATDLAVLKTKQKPPASLSVLPFGDSDAIEIGDWVVAVGAPFGLNESVTAGIISAKGRQNTGITAYGNFLQTDAAINPGNSGGPLVNLEGKVIGINTAIYSRSGGYQGIGFAIPVNLAKTIASSLIEHGKVTRGWLGVSIQSITADMAEALGLEQKTGALVAEVVSGSPAEQAGIMRGDVIVSLGGEEVRDANHLMNRVALLVPGSTVEITLQREGKKLARKVTIAKREEEPANGTDTGKKEERAKVPQLGASVVDLSAEARARYMIAKDVEYGAVVTHVDPGGSAADAGLSEGDVIVEANRKPVRSTSDLRAALRDTKKDTSVLLLVNRRGASSYVAVKPN